MQEELKKMMKIAEEAAREAGSYAASKRGNIGEVSCKKGPSDLVTDVDKKCEGMIIERIKNHFPGHSIIAEESGSDYGGGDVCWIIDPLDGTTNYAHDFPFFCSSIGIVEGQSTIGGVIYDPVRDEFFSAVKGRGSKMNGKKIKVSKVSKVKNSLMATGFAHHISGKISTLPYFTKMLKTTQAIRRAGSAALDLCYVAMGRFDGFWEFGLNPWDMAAGVLIVREAGGTVTNLNGGEFDLFKGELVSSNTLIHQEMTDILNA